MTTTDPHAPLMNGAEFALLRYKLGLSLSQVADFLDVNPRTVRAWNAGRDPIPDGVLLDLDDLQLEHEIAVRKVLEDGYIAIPYNTPDVAWNLAVAASARRKDPDIVVTWDFEWRPDLDIATTT